MRSALELVRTRLGQRKQTQDLAARLDDEVTTLAKISGASQTVATVELGADDTPIEDVLGQAGGVRANIKETRKQIASLKAELEIAEKLRRTLIIIVSCVAVALILAIWVMTN